jgi:peptidyl-prolyl cis-trans isomerase C
LTRRRLLPKWLPVGVTLLALSVTLGAGASSAHDPSTSGGLFRSRNAGATWASANPERIIGAAISLAISPTDPNHLLLATESGLMRSSNGGRDWILESLKSNGAAFAVVFDADGRRALVSTASDIFRTEDGNLWRTLAPPSGTTPARAMVRGAAPGRVYLAGWKRFAQSDDWGTTWVTAADGLPPGPVIALAVQPGPAETVYAIVDGRIWARTDGTPVWQSRMGGVTTVQVEALALDPSDAARIWAVGAGQVFRSDDSGGRWQPVGQPLPTAGTAVHGIAASGRLLLLSTDQGLYRSTDAGDTWQFVTDNLPGHLDAGPLVRDPANPATLYAGFALTPYSELWRAAIESRGRLEQVDSGKVWHWVAAVIGVLAAAICAGWLAGHSRQPAQGLPRSQPVSLPRLVGQALRAGVVRPLREPLVQFFLIGAAFFLLNQWLGGGGNPAGRRIEVSSAQVARLIQAFTEQRGRPPMASETKTVIDEYVREEILFREALEMGLDKGDVVVRRRLAQKMATLVGDLEGSGDPTEEELRTFFDFHADRYRGPVRVRFTHVYFDGERRGASAETEARAALERIRAAQRLPQSAPERGDSFPAQLGNGLRSQAELAELFGQGFAEAVVRFPAGLWRGPVRSKSGYHLVRVDERSVPPVPELAAVRDRVIADWRGARRAETDAAGLARIRTRYEVIIAEPPKSSAAAAEAGGSR